MATYFIKMMQSNRFYFIVGLRKQTEKQDKKPI